MGANKSLQQLAALDPNTRDGQLVEAIKSLLVKKAPNLKTKKENEFFGQVAYSLEDYRQDEKKTDLSEDKKRLRWEIMVGRIVIKWNNFGEGEKVFEHERDALWKLYDFKPKKPAARPQNKPADVPTNSAAAAPPQSAPRPAKFQAPQKLNNGTKLYHASPEKFRESIRKHGLKASEGRCGKAVYMVFTPGQAHKVGIWHCPEGPGEGFMKCDIWSIRVDQKTDPLHVETHPAWCKMQPFKEVMVPERLTGPSQLTLEEDLEIDMCVEDLRKFARDNHLGSIDHLLR